MTTETTESLIRTHYPLRGQRDMRGPAREFAALCLKFEKALRQIASKKEGASPSGIAFELCEIAEEALEEP